MLRAELTHRFGVEWRPIVNGQAEIAGVPDELLTVFSKRTADIDKALADKLDHFRQREGREPSRWERAALTREASADTRSEPPWVWWRLGLLVSNPGGVGLSGSIEGCFVLGGRDVVAVAVEPLVVEPVHPRQGGQLQVVDVVPAGGVGPVHALGLVQAVGCLGQGVVETVRHGADGGSGADLIEPFGEPHRRELTGFKGSKQHQLVGGSVGVGRGLRRVSSSRGLSAVVN